jgi:hypothetical protein
VRQVALSRWHASIRRWREVDPLGRADRLVLVECWQEPFRSLARLQCRTEALPEHREVAQVADLPMIYLGRIVDLAAIFDRPHHRLRDPQRLREQPRLLVRLDEARREPEEQPLDAEVLVCPIAVLDDAAHTGMRRAEVELNVGVGRVEAGRCVATRQCRIRRLISVCSTSERMMTNPKNSCV